MHVEGLALLSLLRFAHAPLPPQQHSLPAHLRSSATRSQAQPPHHGHGGSGTPRLREERTPDAREPHGMERPPQGSSTGGVQELCLGKWLFSHGECSWPRREGCESLHTRMSSAAFLLHSAAHGQSRTPRHNVGEPWTL